MNYTTLTQNFEIAGVNVEFTDRVFFVHTPLVGRFSFGPITNSISNIKSWNW